MKIELIKIKLFSALICIFMFYSCDPEHRETIEPEKPSIENPEEPEGPESPDEPEIPSTNTIINLNNEFMIVGSNIWNSVAYGNGIFVVGGEKGYVTTSTDEGKTWSTPKQLVTIGSWSNVIYANGSFMMLNFYNGKLATSKDGTIWTIGDTYSLNYWRSLAYGNGIYVAVGPSNGTIMTSTDGETWTKRTVGSVIWRDIAYGNGKFIIISNGGYFSTSTDGVTWKSQSRIPNISRGYDVITFGNGKFVVAEGYQGNTQTTTDGETWTTPNTSAGSHNWQSIAASDGKFILVGNSGYVTTSVDGITWETPYQLKDEKGSTVSIILYGVCATQ